MREHLPALILIVVVGGGIFVNALGSEWVLDDHSIIVENPHIRSLRRAFTSFGLQYWFALRKYNLAMEYRDYRPVTEVSFAADYALWGLNRVGYHVTSVLVHMANCVAVYFLAYRIFGDRRGALFAALLFAAHPIHVEAVVWAKARAAPLALLFTLVSLLLYVRFVEESSRGRMLAVYAGSVVVFALALGSKASSVVLPGLIVVYVLCFVPRQRWLRALIGLPPFAAMVAGLMIVYYVLGEHPENVLEVQPYNHLLTVVATVGVYPRLLVLPVGMCLHHYFSVVSTFWDADVLRAIPWEVGLVGGAIAALFLSRKALFALGWLIISMVPLSNAMILGRPIGELRAYGPSVGFCLLVALLLYRMPALGSTESVRQVLRKVSVVSCGSLVVLYSGLTVARNVDWANSFRLFTDTVAKNPRSILAHNDLAKVYYERGDLEKSLEHLQCALAADPFHVGTLDRASYLCRIMGRYPEAIIYYRRMLVREPEQVVARIGLGISYTETRQYGRARQEFETALRLDPDNLEAHYNFGVSCIAAGEYALAAGELRRALEGNAEDPLIHYSLGVAYEKLRQYDLALRHYEDALRLRPERGETWLAMGACYEDMGKYEDAIRCYRRCIEVGPADAGVGVTTEEAKRRLERLAPVHAVQP